MEKREFDQRMSLINSMRAEASKYKNEFINQINGLNTNAKEVLETLENRDEDFIKYLNDLNDFSFSDKYTSPSDLFPGIRTVSDMTDPEETRAKAEEMKNISGDIDNYNKIATLQSKQTSSNLRQALDAFSEYVTRTNQIYDIELELLEDMDSIYDISDLKKAVK